MSLPGRTKPERAMTFASMNEKAGDPGSMHAPIMTGGRLDVRKLPCSKQTFQLITERFHIHGSIARAISRADIPVFSGTEVKMGEYPAFITNCRTTNAWNMDLGLATTYFPHCGLTFAMVFGCSLAIEEDILKRLSFATQEAAYPLLMPGIIAELERSRHIHVVEHNIDKLETKIFELDFKVSDMDGIGDDRETEDKNYEKRNSWLDTAYMRNQLISWNTQLAKMATYAGDLEKHLFAKRPVGTDTSDHSKDHDADDDAKSVTSRRPRSEVDSQSLQRFREQVRSEGRRFLDVDNLSPVQLEEQKRRRQRSRERVNRKLVELSPASLAGSSFNPRRKSTSSMNIPLPRVSVIQDSRPASTQRGGQDEGPADGRPSLRKDSEAFNMHMRRVGDKVKDRVQAIVDEYNDKIRDCTMRVDGMAMATQWVSGIHESLSVYIRALTMTPVGRWRIKRPDCARNATRFAPHAIHCFGDDGFPAWDILCCEFSSKSTLSPVTCPVSLHMNDSRYSP